MRNERERTADLWSGIGWIVFGVIIVVHASMMETRTHLGATFLTGPGLVPGMIGSAIAVLGVVLVARSLRGQVVPWFAELGEGSGRRVAMALALMLVYGIGLIGSIRFEIATFLFVTAFVIVFNLPQPGPRALALLGAKAAATGLLTAAAISFVFVNMFLVRLP